MNDMIRTDNLSRTYGSGAVATHALRGANLAIPKGSFTCIVGPSGHGKSTLLHLVGGLDRPTTGTVHIGGVELTSLDSSALARLRGSKIGFVFQFFNLLRTLTASENIATAMMLAGVPARQQAERARELLERVGLAEKAGARPGELSGGQQQRVAIARALANDPDLLLPDEPTGNLDSEAEAGIIALLHDLHRRGKTVVVVTHNHEIAQQAERIITVRDGRIAA
ncbi:MAG: ABC transporter ATP-binding protein [Desulfuromonadales bacterium]|nr:ABC transporter ATP-binding protein [Desulfuromonadales bacterium]